MHGVGEQLREQRDAGAGLLGQGVHVVEDEDEVLGDGREQLVAEVGDHVVGRPLKVEAGVEAGEAVRDAAATWATRLGVSRMRPSHEHQAQGRRSSAITWASRVVLP